MKQKIMLMAAAGMGLLLAGCALLQPAAPAPTPTPVPTVKPSPTIKDNKPTLKVNKPTERPTVRPTVVPTSKKYWNITK